MKVVHLTSAHPRYDSRIFLKQCQSLAEAGHEVTLIVADGLGNEQMGRIQILDVGARGSRLQRAILSSRAVVQRGLDVDAELYHLHDPELLPGALKLKKQGKHVIFDSHEDVSQDILTKPYLPVALRRGVASGFGVFERFVCTKIDHVVAATPTIRDKFIAAGIPSTDIKNFPIIHELESNAPWSHKANQICYVGGIAAIRGLHEMVAAMALCTHGTRLALAGEFNEGPLRQRVVTLDGWRHVDELGQLQRAGVKETLARSFAGLVTLHPTTAYLSSMPIKMFEYMSAGIPVIASDFPLWRAIIEKEDCGICVDPLNPASIAQAIDWLAANPEEARRMGQNGQVAVQNIYNWQHEAKTLVELYKEFA